MIGKKWIISCISIIGLLFLSIFMFSEQIFTAIGNYLIIKDDLKPADVIHVIAGDDYRTFYAIDLYKQGYGNYIFFTGGWCRTHGWDHGTHARELALGQGVPDNAIVFDDESVKSTYDEALRLKAWMDNGKITVRSVIVVSDPFHMRRARWTYRNIFGNTINLIMSPVPFEQTPFKQQWWTDNSSINYIKEEYIKLVYYLLRYQLSMKWLAAFDTE
jgi:uncharacterized SAM-binding protein YcdF (DUF218 family)